MGRFSGLGEVGGPNNCSMFPPPLNQPRSVKDRHSLQANNQLENLQSSWASLDLLQDPPTGPPLEAGN